MVIIPHLVEAVTPNMWSSQFLMIVRILATGIIQTKEEVVVTLLDISMSTYVTSSVHM